MSKQHRNAVDFKALIAGSATPPEPEKSSAEVVTLEQPAAETAPRRAKPAAGKGTLKERSIPMSLYLEPAVHDQLRELAFTERAKMHGLVLEGLDLLFKKRGVRSIAGLTKAVK